MKKPLSPKRMTGLTAAAGLLGLALQVWLRTGGLDSRGLYVVTHPGNLLTLALTVLTLVWAGLSLLRLTAKVPPYGQLFPRSGVPLIGCGIAAAGILASSLFQLVQLPDAVHIVCLISGLAAAGSLLYVGFCRYQGIHPGFLFRGIVCVYMILHLVAQYRTWSGEPQAVKYLFPLLASLALLAWAYYRTCLDAGFQVRRWYVATHLAALYLCLVATVSEQGLFYLTMAAWLATEQCSLQPVRRTKKAMIQLPDSVTYCINALEKAGYEAYVVGGCVRDTLLRLSPNDYDLCTNATPDAIAQVFADHPLLRNGEKHGTIGVVIHKQVYEITTFRTESGYSDSRHPDQVTFVNSLTDDLSRRDFTVNAMAYAPKTGYADPWGGRADLKARVLRCVGEPVTRFTEDPLRILRGVRFAVRFGLTPEQSTLSAMLEMAPLMETLARERVFEELCKLLPYINAQQLALFSPILTQVLPELSPCVNFEQHSPHHAYDVYTHTALVTQAVPGELPLRWAALLHDIGKPQTFSLDEEGRGHFLGHAQVGAQMAQQLLLRLKAPNALREQVVFLIEHHMTPFAPERQLLLRRLTKFGMEACLQLLTLQEADFTNKGVSDEEQSHFLEIRTVLAQLAEESLCLSLKDLAINGNDLLALGYDPSPAIGETLAALLELVQDDILPNDSQALLEAAKNMMEEAI